MLKSAMLSLRFNSIFLATITSFGSLACGGGGSEPGDAGMGGASTSSGGTMLLEFSGGGPGSGGTSSGSGGDASTGGSTYVENTACGANSYSVTGTWNLQPFPTIHSSSISVGGGNIGASGELDDIVFMADDPGLKYLTGTPHAVTGAVALRQSSPTEFWCGVNGSTITWAKQATTFDFDGYYLGTCDGASPVTGSLTLCNYSSDAACTETNTLDGNALPTAKVFGNRAGEKNDGLLSDGSYFRYEKGIDGVVRGFLMTTASGAGQGNIYCFEGGTLESGPAMSDGLNVTYYVDKLTNFKKVGQCNSAAASKETIVGCFEN